jgi:hypothetical protein
MRGIIGSTAGIPRRKPVDCVSVFVVDNQFLYRAFFVLPFPFLQCDWADAGTVD